MQNIRVGLLLKDQEFAAILAESLARESRQLCFTVSEEETCDSDFDVVLTDYDLKISNQIMLVDSKKNENLAGGQYRLFRYRSASDMVKNIAYIVYEITGDTLTCRGDGSLSVICVFSFTGGSGVSEIAKGICGVLYDYFDKRCVYVNLSAHYNSNDEAADEEQFRKLIYYLRYRENFPIDFFLKSEERYEYISRSKIAIYQEDFSSEVCARLVNRLRKEAKWKYVVIDCGNYINQEKISIISSSDYILQVEDGRRDIRETPFFLNSSLEEEKKVIRVLNFADMLEETPVNYIDMQRYDDVTTSEDFLYKLSLIGQLIGGEVDD